MKINTRNDKDLLSGLLFLGFGAVAVWTARSYPIYSDSNFGAGAFPIGLGLILAVIGLLQIIFGLMSKVREAVDFGDLRPIFFLSLGAMAFGVIIPEGGIVLALLALVSASACATKGFRLIEVATIFVILVFLCSAILVVGLSIPIAELFPH